MVPPDLHAWLAGVAGRLAGAGTGDDVTLAQQLVRRCQLLAAGETVPGREGLGRSLNRLSLALARLGDAEDSLTAAEGVCSIHRRNAGVGDRTVYPSLAGSLGNLSRMLTGRDRHEEAVAARRRLFSCAGSRRPHIPSRTPSASPTR